VKVLVVTNMYPTDARPYFGVQVARQVESLRRAGVTIVLEAIAGDRGEADYFLARRRLARLVRIEQPDLIHCHFGYTPLAAAFLGRPYLVTLCGDDVNGESDGRGGITLKSRLGILVTQVCARAAARVIVKSAAMRDRLWPAARRKAELVPNGVDEDLFRPLPRREARQRLGIRADALVLAFVNSGGQATKRLDLATATRDALAGRGRAAQLVVAEHIPPAAMPWYYGAADCLLMTSDLEGSPNCVKEALACGVPVVSVPVGQVPELVDTPARGRVVPRDPTALADAVDAVVRAQPPTRSSLLPDALRAASVAERLLGIYARVSRERPVVAPVAAH
jgi:glycosyltransferase involved in cell wall biosynthesis